MKRADVCPALIDGHDRGADSCWTGKIGESVEIRFAEKTAIGEIRIILDSDLDRKTVGAEGNLPEKPTLANYPLDQPTVHVPQTIVKDLTVETLDGTQLAKIEGNYQRLLIIPTDAVCTGIRITPTATHGTETVRIFSVNVK